MPELGWSPAIRWRSPSCSARAPCSSGASRRPAGSSARPSSARTACGGPFGRALSAAVPVGGSPATAARKGGDLRASFLQDGDATRAAAGCGFCPAAATCSSGRRPLSHCPGVRPLALAVTPGRTGKDALDACSTCGSTAPPPPVLPRGRRPGDSRAPSWRYDRPGNTGIQGDLIDSIWMGPDGDPCLGGYDPVREEGGVAKFVQAENRWINISNIDYPVIGNPDDRHHPCERHRRRRGRSTSGSSPGVVPWSSTPHWRGLAGEPSRRAGPGTQRRLPRSRHRPRRPPSGSPCWGSVAPSGGLLRHDADDQQLALLDRRA